MAFRSINFPSLWKMSCPFSRMWRHAAGKICAINARALALPLASYRVSSRDRIADDRIGDKPPALIADLEFDARPSGQFLLAANLGDSRAQLVVRLDAVLRAVDSALHLRVAQVASRVAAADELVEFEDCAPSNSRLTWLSPKAD